MAIIEIKRKPAGPPARDLRTVYRIAYEYNLRHSPPGEGLEYWRKVVDDLVATNNRYSDPLLTELLKVALADLEREWKWPALNS